MCNQIQELEEQLHSAQESHSVGRDTLESNELKTNDDRTGDNNKTEKTMDKDNSDSNENENENEIERLLNELSVQKKELSNSLKKTDQLTAEVSS